MQQFQRLRWCDWLRLLLILQTVEVIKSQFTANNIQESGARRSQNALIYPNYFFMDLNGSYKYAFDTGSGLTSEQSANQANEVTGQYSYFENGVPYMVKYKAGVQGYQAEIIPSDNMATPGPMTNMPPPQQNTGKNVFETSLLSSAGQKLTPTTPTAMHAVETGIRPQFRQAADNRAILEAARSAVGVNTGGMLTTLQFVQDAMQTMRSRPLQVSFTSQQRFGLPAANVPANSGSFRLLPQSSMTPAPVTNDEIQQINALAENSMANTAAPVAAQLRRYPYEFSYLSQQSSRTESADKSGNVVGKYSYYDDAGFHDLTYKAGDDIGFVVLGGSLAEQREQTANRIIGPLPTQPSAPSSAAADNMLPNDSPFLIVNVQQQPNVNYHYRVSTDAPNIDRRAHRDSHNSASASSMLGNNGNGNGNNNNINIKPDNNGRSLRKFRRNANW